MRALFALQVVQTVGLVHAAQLVPQVPQAVVVEMKYWPVPQVTQLVGDWSARVPLHVVQAVALVHATQFVMAVLQVPQAAVVETK